MSAEAYTASDGALYERFLGRWTRRLAEQLLDFAAFPADGELLDAGCGTGNLALTMAARWPGRRISGIDLAAPYVAFARNRPGAADIKFDVGDLTLLPYENGRFAGAGTQLALNFVANPLEALREMRRIVRPGGVIAAAVWDFRGGLVYQRLLWDSAAGIDQAARRIRDRLFSHPLSLPDGLPNLFAQAGLQGIAQSSLTIRMDFANFADYWQPLLYGQGPVGVYVASLEHDRREAIERLVREAYLAGAPDGPRSLIAAAWAARGAALG